MTKCVRPLYSDTFPMSDEQKIALRLRILMLAAIMVPPIAGCGGGGSGKSTTPPPPPPVSNEHFEDATASSGIQFDFGYLQVLTGTFDRDVQMFAGGAASGDCDNDNDVDLFIVRGDIGPNLLYLNNGDASFVESAASAGLAFTKSATENYRHSGPTFADLDGDADLDLFVGGLFGDPSFLFRNTGNCTFEDISASAGLDALTGINNISAAFGDYDLDGDLDMYVTHWGTPRTYGNPGDTHHLWRNDTAVVGGDISFTSVSIESEISPSVIAESTQGNSNYDYSFAPTFARMNDDLYPDIVVTSDFNTSQIFFNDGDSTFSNMTDDAVVTDNNGMGSAVGDYDNDGDLDWFVSAILDGALPNAWTGNRFYQNNGGVFEDATEAANVLSGGWGWGACFVDFENDGDLDLYQTNGFDVTSIPRFQTDVTRAFVLQDSMTYMDMASELGLNDREEGRGVVCADFDNDGDIDIFQLHRNEDNAASLYRNDLNFNNSISIRLKGHPPNTEAVGARVYATSGASTQMREIMIGNNFTSQNPTTQVVGLGAAAQVDTLRVQWPDGRETTMNNVQAGQRIVVRHPDL